MIDAGCFEVESDGERFVLGIHTDNPAHEARIRWEAVNRGLSGKWGRLYLPEEMAGGIDQVIQEPILVFETGEAIVIDDKDLSSVELPRPLASRLQESLDEFGTAIVDSASVETNPDRFPASIEYQTRIATEHLDKAWWDSTRLIMWYAPNKPEVQNLPTRLAELISRVDLYGYQIEQENLVHRTNEIPTERAVNELKSFLEQIVPRTDMRADSGSYQIEHPLE